MKVRYIHPSPGFYGNILFPRKWPMCGGRFPGDHPCAPHDTFEMEMGHSAGLEEFRKRGYWASCFPEGDGITMSCNNGQDADTVRRDIAECFGWEATP